MATPLATLGQFRIGTTEYAAGRARTSGQWHMVRKQYGDNSSTYSYAVFTAKSDYLAATQNPDSATWYDEPFSSLDYSLLLLPMATPLPTSTASMGVVAAAGGDSANVVQAIDTGNTILANMLAGQSSAGSRATETTLAKVLGALSGTLSVTATGTFFQPVQPVSGPATDAQLRAAPLPVSVAFPAVQAVSISATVPVTGQFWQTIQPVSLSAVPLAAGAATATLQSTGNALLTDVKGLLGGALTFTLPTGAATAVGQASQQTALDAIKASAALGSTAALQTALNSTVALASKQDAGNALLSDMKAALGTPALAAGAATTANQLIGNTSLNSVDSKLTGVATAAKQDAGNTSLAAIQASTAVGATAAGQATQAAKQDTANGYLQALAQTGIATTAAAAVPFSLVTANGSNATLVHAGATWLLGGSVTNTATAVRFLFLYNLAAVPATTMPTTTAGGLVRTIAIGTGATVSLNLPAGRYTGFSLGLVIAAASASTLSTLTSSAAGLTGSIGLTIGELIVNLDWAS